LGQTLHCRSGNVERPGTYELIQTHPLNGSGAPYQTQRCKRIERLGGHLVGIAQKAGNPIGTRQAGPVAVEKSQDVPSLQRRNAQVSQAFFDRRIAGAILNRRRCGDLSLVTSVPGNRWHDRWCARAALSLHYVAAIGGNRARACCSGLKSYP
jgi:hypothetical protein